MKFVESHVSKAIAFQTQSMRAKKGWTQQELAKRLGSNQNAVYRLENPYYGKQTVTTLRKVASEFDVGLIVLFVPFSQMVDWVSGTPHVDPGLTPSALEVPDFETEITTGIFEEQTQREVAASAPMEESAVEGAIAEKISGADALRALQKTSSGLLLLTPTTEPANSSSIDELWKGAKGYGQQPPPIPGAVIAAQKTGGLFHEALGGYPR